MIYWDLTVVRILFFYVLPPCMPVLLSYKWQNDVAHGKASVALGVRKKGARFVRPYM